MAILHDYKCDLHGFFEAWEPVCPDGCTENVQMVFLQPVGMKSDATKHNDKTINQLALDFNMTNIKSAREGENQSGFYTRNNKPLPKDVPPPPRESRPGDAVMWGNAGGKLNMDTLLKGNAFRSVAGESVGVSPSTLGNLTTPKTASYMQDHENLQVSKP
jgi:hypothetical protein